VQSEWILFNPQTRKSKESERERGKEESEREKRKRKRKDDLTPHTIGFGLVNNEQQGRSENISVLNI